MPAICMACQLYEDDPLILLRIGKQVAQDTLPYTPQAPIPVLFTESRSAKKILKPEAEIHPKAPRTGPGIKPRYERRTSASPRVPDSPRIAPARSPSSSPEAPDKKKRKEPRVEVYGRRTSPTESSPLSRRWY